MANGSSSKRSRAATQPGWVADEWADVVAGAEAGRARRGRQWARQGAVTELRLEENALRAVVKGNGLPVSGVEVRLPRVCCTETQQQTLADILANRPDWLASMLTNTWTTGIQEALIQAKISLFPEPSQILTKAECACGDSVRPCAHMTAVAYRWLTEVQSSPLKALEYVGIERRSLLERAHRCSLVADEGEATMHEGENGGYGINENVLNEVESVIEGGLWTEERAVLLAPAVLGSEAQSATESELHHTLDPVWQENRLEVWQKRYLTWKFDSSSCR